MKVVVFALLAAWVASVSAFAPVNHQATRFATQHSLVDPDVAYQLADAVRATIMDCTDGHCKFVDAWKETDGHWHFEDRSSSAFRSESLGTASRVLMLEFDETE